MISNNDGKNIHRYDTKANWTKYNPILAKGELVVEDDNGNIKQKIGNGSSNYISLPYIGGSNCPYNIGDIYITMREGNPNTIWKDTTWEQIEQGRVLLSQGSNYPLGSKGGEATHTLTVSEMPKHSHTRNGYYNTNWDGNERNRACASWQKLPNDRIEYGVNEVGESKPHNNLPPYISVYLWKRTS